MVSILQYNSPCIHAADQHSTKAVLDCGGQPNYSQGIINQTKKRFDQLFQSQKMVGAFYAEAGCSLSCAKQCTIAVLRYL